MSERLRKGARVSVDGQGLGRVVGFITERLGYPGRRRSIVVVRLDEGDRYRECNASEITIVDEDDE